MQQPDESQHPLTRPDGDKHCSFIYPASHPQGGQLCEGFHTTDSLYCFRHGELANEYEEKRKVAIQKRAKLLDEIVNEYTSLRTNDDFVIFIEKIINGVKMGAFRDPKTITMITQLMAYAGQHIKAAKDSKDPATLSSITISEHKTIELTWQTDSDLDRFLQAGDPRVQIRILEDMQKAKQVKSKAMTEPEPIDVPLIETKELPPHEWKTALIPQPQGFSYIKHTCQKCGKVSDIKSKKGECPA